MPDYIPRSDVDFLNWAQTFSTYLEAHAGPLDIEPPTLMAIQSKVSAFSTTYAHHLTAGQAASAAKEAKNVSRSAAEEAIRTLVRQIQANPKVDDGLRAGLGIRVRDRIRSLARSRRKLSSRPIAVVDASRRYRHEILFMDESTPTSRAKPKGVMGCEIWVAVKAANEAPPANASEYTFVAMDTATPYMVEYTGDEVGKTAHYLLRWVKTNGEKGPLSETVSATIMG